MEDGCRKVADFLRKSQHSPPSHDVVSVLGVAKSKSGVEKVSPSKEEIIRPGLAMECAGVTGTRMSPLPAGASRPGKHS